MHTTLASRYASARRSFLHATKNDVTYNIYCGEEGRLRTTRLCPFVEVSDSDVPHEANNVITGAGNCVPAPAVDTAVLIGHGELNITLGDLTDLWDLVFYAPVCTENYNAITDPVHRVCRRASRGQLTAA